MCNQCVDSRHQKDKTSLGLNVVRDVGDAMASAGPYANNLHLVPKQITTPTPRQSVFQAGCFS